MPFRALCKQARSHPPRNPEAGRQKNFKFFPAALSAFLELSVPPCDDSLNTFQITATRLWKLMVDVNFVRFG